MPDFREAFRLIQGSSPTDMIERAIEGMVLSDEIAVGERIPETEIAGAFPHQPKPCPRSGPGA